MFRRRIVPCDCWVLLHRRSSSGFSSVFHQGLSRRRSNHDIGANLALLSTPRHRAPAHEDHEDEPIALRTARRSFGRLPRGLPSRWWPFKKAREFVREQNIFSSLDWQEWSRTERPYFIPSNPHKAYTAEEGWRGYQDWCGWADRKKPLVRRAGARRSWVGVRDWAGRVCGRGRWLRREDSLRKLRGTWTLAGRKEVVATKKTMWERTVSSQDKLRLALALTARPRRTPSSGDEHSCGRKSASSRDSSSRKPAYAARDSGRRKNADHSSSSSDSNTTSSDSNTTVPWYSNPRKTGSPGPTFCLDTELSAARWFRQHLEPLGFEFFGMPKGCRADLIYRLRPSGTAAKSSKGFPSPSEEGVSSVHDVISEGLLLHQSAEQDVEEDQDKLIVPAEDLWAPLQMKATARIHGATGYSKFTACGGYDGMGLVMVNTSNWRCFMALGKDINVQSLSITERGKHAVLEKKTAVEIAEVLREWWGRPHIRTSSCTDTGTSTKGAGGGATSSGSSTTSGRKDAVVLPKKSKLGWQRESPGCYSDTTHFGLMAWMEELIYAPLGVELRYAPHQFSYNSTLRFELEDSTAEGSLDENSRHQSVSSDMERRFAAGVVQPHHDSRAFLLSCDVNNGHPARKKSSPRMKTTLNVLHRAAVDEERRLSFRVTVQKKHAAGSDYGYPHLVPFSEDDPIHLFVFMVQGKNNEVRGLFLFPKTVFRDPYLSSAPAVRSDSSSVQQESYNIPTSRGPIADARRAARGPVADNERRMLVMPGRPGRCHVSLYPPEIAKQVSDPLTREIAEWQLRYYVDLTAVRDCVRKNEVGKMEELRQDVLQRLRAAAELMGGPQGAESGGDAWMRGGGEREGGSLSRGDQHYSSVGQWSCGGEWSSSRGC